MERMTWPRLIEAIRRDKRIDSWSNETASGEGFWVYTKPGFCNKYDEPHGGLHTIHEAHPQRIWMRLRYISPCTCPECTKETPHAQQESIRPASDHQAA